MFKLKLLKLELCKLKFFKLNLFKYKFCRLGGRLGSFLVLLGADLDILRGPGVSFWGS